MKQLFLVVNEDPTCIYATCDNYIEAEKIVNYLIDRAIEEDPFIEDEPYWIVEEEIETFEQFVERQ